MTGQELQAVQRRMGLSRQHFADLLGISVARMSEWSNGKLEIPRLTSSTASPAHTMLDADELEALDPRPWP